MNNTDKLFQSFSEALSISTDAVSLDLSYQSIPEWDSISHMILISQIESDFSVSIDTEDVIEMSTVQKAIDILKKHDVQF